MVLPKLVTAFEAYVAEISVRECTTHEFEAWRSFVAKRQEQEGQRYPVFRIPPVCFYSRTICLQTFGLMPEAIAEQLEGKVDRLNGSIIIV